MFMSSDDVARTTVAESLKEKLSVKQTELGSRLSGEFCKNSYVLPELNLISSLYIFLALLGINDLPNL